MSRRIAIHIEELRLVGLSDRHPEAIGDGIRQGLHQLIAHGGVPSTQDTHVDHIRAPLNVHDVGAALGRAAAKSAYEGMRR